MPPLGAMVMIVVFLVLCAEPGKTNEKTYLFPCSR
jgi:hypothetical protein